MQTNAIKARQQRAHDLSAAPLRIALREPVSPRVGDPNIF
jgi:hypothetical protein